MVEPIITLSMSQENAISLESELEIIDILTRTRNGKSVYDFSFKDRSNGLRRNMDFSSRISGIDQNEFEQIFGDLRPEDLSDRTILLNLGIPVKYHVEHRGSSMKGQIEIVKFERIERYTLGMYEDEVSGPLTFVDIKTHGLTRDPNLLGYVNYDLNLLFGAEKYDELEEYFSDRRRHSNSYVMSDSKPFNRAPLKVRKFELKK